MDGLDKLISRLGSFWKSRRKKAVDELVDRGLKEPDQVVPALMEAMKADKEKISNNAWEAYQTIAEEVDVVPILLSNLNGPNHGVAVDLLNRRGANATKYLGLLSEIEEDTETLASMGVDIDEFNRVLEEAQDTYHSRNFDEGISSLKQTKDRVRSSLLRAEKLDRRIKDIEEEISYLESYNIGKSDFEESLESIKRKFREREFDKCEGSIDELKTDIDKKKEETAGYRERIDELDETIEEGKAVGLDLQNIEREIDSLTPSTPASRIDELEKELDEEVKEKVREKKMDGLGWDMESDWEGTEPRDWIRSLEIGKLGGKEIVAAGSLDGNVYVWDENGELLWTGTKPMNGIMSVSVGELGGKEIVAAGSRDDSVYVWDEDGTLLWQGKELDSGACNISLGKLGEKDVIAAGSDIGDGNVYVWDENGKLLWKGTEPKNSTYEVAVGKLGDKDVVAAGSGESKKDNVYVWDEEGTLLWKGTEPEGFFVGLVVGELGGYPVVAAGSLDGNIYVWDKDGRLLWKGTEPKNSITGPVVGQLGDKDVVVAGSEDDDVYVYDKDGKLLWKGTEQEDYIRGIAVDRLGGKDVVVAGSKDEDVYVYDEDGVLLWKGTEPEDSIWSVVVGELGGRDVLAAVSNDDVYVWKSSSAVKKIFFELRELKNIVASSELEKEFHGVIDSVDIEDIRLTEDQREKLDNIENIIEDRKISATELQEELEKNSNELKRLSIAGIDVEELDTKMKESEKLFAEGDLENSEQKLDDIEKEIERLKEISRPKLKMQFQQTERLEPDVWAFLRLKLNNTGHVHAKNIQIDIGGEVKVHGEHKIDQLKVGSSEEIEVRIQASGKGHVPVEVKTEYDGALKGKEYEETHQPDLVVGEDISVADEEEKEVTTYTTEQEIRKRIGELTDKEEMLDVRKVIAALDEDQVKKAGKLLAELEERYQEYEEIIKNLKELDDRKSQLAEQLAEEKIDRSTFNDAMEGIKSKKYELENKLESLRNEVIYEDYEKPF